MQDGEQPARLRRQLVQAGAKHLVRQRIGARDVGRRHFDVFERGVSRPGAAGHGPERPLMLVQKRDDIDQGQVLLVVAARAGAVVEEGQFPGVGIHHTQRTQQSLGVLVDLEDRVALVAGEHPFERLAFALEPVDGLRPDHHDANPPQPITTTMAFSFATSAYDARW